MKILGGTGHRSLKKDFDYKFEAFMNKKYPDRTSLSIISGGAVGFDLKLAEWAFKNNVPYDLFMSFPFEVHSALWNQSDKARLEILIKNAKEVLVLSPIYESKFYTIRDRMIIDKCTEVVCYYDGRKNGGTAYTYRYAKKNGKIIENIF